MTELGYRRFKQEKPPCGDIVQNLCHNPTSRKQAGGEGQWRKRHALNRTGGVVSSLREKDAQLHSTRLLLSHVCCSTAVFTQRACVERDSCAFQLKLLRRFAERAPFSSLQRVQLCGWPGLCITTRGGEEWQSPCVSLSNRSSAMRSDL